MIDQPLLRFQIQFKSLQNDLGKIQKRLEDCYTENPLQFWTKNKIEARLTIIDKNSNDHNYQEKKY